MFSCYLGQTQAPIETGQSGVRGEQGWCHCIGVFRRWACNDTEEGRNQKWQLQRRLGW